MRKNLVFLAKKILVDFFLSKFTRIITIIYAHGAELAAYDGSTGFFPYLAGLEARISSRSRTLAYKKNMAKVTIKIFSKTSFLA